MTTSSLDHVTPLDAASGPAGPLAGRLALKEWGAAIHALLQGRQQILLRKGGIHEKAFATPESGASFLLFPTHAHTHAERMRPGLSDLLAVGSADAGEDEVVIRAGVRVVETIPVLHPERLPELGDLHIWTDASVQADRVDFRPAKALQILVVQTLPLREPLTLARLDSYGGCRSWLELEVGQVELGPAVQGPSTLDQVQTRVHAAVG